VDHDEDGALRVVALDHHLDCNVGREEAVVGGQERTGDVAYSSLGLRAQINEDDAAAVRVVGALLALSRTG